MRAAIGGGAEVEEPLELRANALRVGVDLLERQQRSLLALAARIADEPGAAADQSDRRVSRTLQPRERHHRQQRADVQARAVGIEADVGGDASRARASREALGRVVHRPRQRSRRTFMSTHYAATDHRSDSAH